MTVHVVVTQQIARFLDCPPADVAASDVAGALDALFEQQPQLRPYILDERDRLRRHVRLFVNGTAADGLSQALRPGDEVYVMQSLTGG